jgi:pimeloyl-ACP methyl ester carboxylesterase
MMQQLHYRMIEGQRSRDLLILMPGAGDAHDGFEQHGFVAAARASNYDRDIIAAHAHYDFFTDQTVAERLHHDVVQPARGLGYERIALGGISLGAFASLIYAKDRPTEVDSLVLFAPYIGNRGTLREIDDAGGLDAWQATELPAYDERRVWQFLKRFSGSHQPIPIQLLAGRNDRFAPFHDLLATRLPHSAVTRIEGGHDWLTYEALWREFLKRNTLRR